jgi:tetratricopeptide (TPR) repeat protein
MIPLRRVFVITALAAAVVLGTGPVAADWDAGRQLYNEGRFAEAAVHFRETVGSNPNWPSGYLMLGRCQLALEEYDEALENLRTAVELGPDDPTNTVTLGRALMTVERYAEARELLDGLETDGLPPEWKAEVARMQAACLIEEDRAADAVALLEACLANDPNRAALHRAMAVAHKAAGDRTATLDDLTRAFHLDPADDASGRAAVIAALALAADAGDDELAAGYYGRACEIADELATASPDYEHTLLAGEAAFAAGRFEAAAGWFGTAVRSKPQEPAARFDLGRTMAALDHNDEAVVHLRAALGAAPDAELATRIHGQLGRLLACSLELPEAARHYRAAGDSDRADEIDNLSGGFREALERLAALRDSAAEFARMEAQLDELGDAKGVTALSDHRKVISREIAAIEGNLSEVRAALCR